MPLLLIVLVTNASLLKFDAAATVLAFTAAPPSSNGRSGLKQGYGTNSLGIKDVPSNWVLSKSRDVPVLARYRQLSASNSVNPDADATSTSSDDTGPNNGADQQTNGLDVTRGATLAPYHILQPDAFPWQNQNGLPVDGSDGIVMSLNSALRILTKALTKMMDEVLEYNVMGGDRAVGSAMVDLLNQYCTERVPASSSSHGPVVLRIEQILSHEVDPLRWLHANPEVWNRCAKRTVLEAYGAVQRYLESVEPGKLKRRRRSALIGTIAFQLLVVLALVLVVIYWRGLL